MPQNDEKKWTILESEYVIRNKFLTVRKDHIRQPSGVEIPDYWVLEYPEWVNVIAIDKEGRFIIERQYRHGVAQTLYEIPAGCVEKGEDPLEAAQRELSEETGYEGGTWQKLLTLCPNGTSMNNWAHCYVARNVEKKRDAHQEKTEDIDVLLLTKEEVFKMLTNGEFPHSTMAAPLWKFFCLEK